MARRRIARKRTDGGGDPQEDALPLPRNRTHAQPQGTGPRSTIGAPPENHLRRQSTRDGREIPKHHG